MSFCDRYADLGGDLAGLAKWFLVAALLTALASAVVEILNKYGTPSVQRIAPSATAIKDVAEALKELITALSAAPVWLALFGAGILLFWIPGSALEACPASMIKPITPVTSSAGSHATATPAANSQR